MFPTEDLIEKLKNTQQLVVGIDSSNLYIAVAEIKVALDNLTQALINHYEWKKKPFMEGMSKELPK